MAGERFPVVLAPRFSTVAGISTFCTVGLDVSQFSKGEIAVWRAQMVGSIPSFALTFQESDDQDTWTNCQNVAADLDPGADAEAIYDPDFSKRYLRLKVTLSGTGPVATWYAVGYLIKRR